MTPNVAMLLFSIYLNSSDLAFKMQVTMSPIMPPGEQVLLLPCPRVSQPRSHPGMSVLAGVTGDTKLGTAAWPLEES